MLGLITLPSISAYRKLSVQKKVNYILTSIAAILLKAAIIYLCFRLFTLVTVIPGTGKIFTALNLSMGMNQVITASIATVIGFGINLGFCQKQKIEKK